MIVPVLIFCLFVCLFGGTTWQSMSANIPGLKAVGVFSYGIAIKKKGRPAKDSIVTEEDKLYDLRYKLARKDAKIKQLEMENELMRDFLSFTERK